MFHHCVVPKNIHTSPTEGIFPNTSPPLWKFQLSSIHFFKFFSLKEPPSPQEIPIPSVGGVWIFSGTAHYGFVSWITVFHPGLPGKLPITRKFVPVTGLKRTGSQNIKMTKWHLRWLIINKLKKKHWSQNNMYISSVQSSVSFIL